MSRIISFIALFIVFMQINAQSAPIVCRAGFTFEISDSPNWGSGEPVIVNITPGSSAEKAGLKPNDIILEVNNKGTYLKPSGVIKNWMLDNDMSYIELSIRNLTTDFKTVRIDKDCTSSNAIDESKLASVFAFYSLEDVQKRTFDIPMKITSNPQAVFTDYRTFDFAPSNDYAPSIDSRISAIFERMLKKQGLNRDTKDPDIIIQTFYSYQNNPSYKGSPQLESNNVLANWRFDIAENKMIKLPLFSPSDVVDDSEVPYFLEFGYRFYDKKHIDPDNMVMVWECEVKEKLKSNYGLEKYLENNLPLILLKYPYPGSANLATYEVNYLKYNYTGISYNINDIAKVAFIDSNSPASVAGIRRGDYIKSIQSVKLNNDLTALTSSYRQFISKTMNLRNPNTRYIDIEGYKNCMFWDVGSYNQVSKTLSKRDYRTAFAYLFNFNQYIDWETPRTLLFEIERDKERMYIEVVPEVYKSTQVNTF